MDPENIVVRLCTAGMRAETAGRPDSAKALFDRAWHEAGDDYERCIAAHYVARHQPTIDKTLRWNRACLEAADAVGDERVASFYPSLHTTLGRCYGELGDRENAGRHFRSAAEQLATLPEGPYRDGLRFAIADGLREFEAAPEVAGGPELEQLLTAWCRRRDLRSLGLVLPAVVGHLGTAADHERLAQAVQQLHTERRLPPQEQEALGRAAATLSRPRTPSASSPRGPE